MNETSTHCWREHLDGVRLTAYRGLTRFQHSGQRHFVTFCFYHRCRLLTADESRRIFASALERVRRSFKLHVYGYVVMPEHVHLLLSETAAGY
jgi:putative transposase